ncbi:hypothetical protein RRF57_004862 [Xylaria bambusicola]|uniref:SP-RING-type domain-containing protein n=1 Tax=Xylaria bambusicola TaxID=326684 RepID=A0AAN7Z489_9PEZI
MAPVGGTVASLGPGKSRGHGQSSALSLAASLDGRQVAAANSTLNAWSSRRQPSWLANATPVQPTPRPPARPPSVTNTSTPFAVTPATEMTLLQPQPQPKPRSQAQPQLQPHPPSRPPPQPRHPSQSNPRQQPQSSDRPAPSPPASALSRPVSSPPPHSVTAAGPLRLSTSLADPALPSPATSNEPSPPLSLFRGGLNSGNSCPISPRNNPPTAEAHFVLDNDVNTRPRSSPQSRVLTSPAQNGRSVSPPQVQPLPVAPSNEEMSDHTQTPNVIAAGSVGSVSADTFLPQAPKRRRYEASRNSAMACLEGHNAKNKLNAYLQEMGGEQALEEVIERPRFLLLVKACREGDIFFVALHQLFCSWTVSQILVHALCDEKVHDTSLIDNAFGVMGTILKANSKLRAHLLRWFAHFPVPLPTLQHDRFYAQAINQVLNFLICVSKRWSIVNHEHLTQGYPLLMSELIHTFNLHSPILQGIVFRASRRTLGVPDNPIGIRLDEMFRADQEKHRNLEDGTCSLRLGGAAYEEYNNGLAQRYKSLIAIAKAQRTTPRRSSQSPSIPPASTAHSSATSSPSLASEYFQFDMTQAPRPAPPATSTGRRVSSNGQNTHSPSPTYSPITPAPPMALPNTTATFSPQLYSFPTHPMSPYQSPNISQHGQYGPPNPYVQQIPHQQAYHEQLRQLQVQHQLQHQLHLQQQQLDWQQQQQCTPLQQQLQQLQYAQRKRSQPGGVPSPRPSPIQTTRVLPGQAPMARHIQPQNINHQPVSPASFVNSHQTLGNLTIAQQSGLVNSLLSPQAVNATQSINAHPHSVAALQRQPNQAIEKLFPVHPNQRINLQDYPHTPYEKRSIDMSLHQAHLRSPKRVLKTFCAGPPERHYQAIKSFALEPAPITPQGGLYKFSFNVTDKILEKLTLNERVAGEALLVNRFNSGSLRIRARCCYFSTVTGPIPDHTWVTSDTTWPDQIFMSLDNQPLEVMRKQHHSKDLPVELSSFIHQGENTLSVAILQTTAQRKQQNPYIAVEIVEVLSHSAILEMVHVSASRPANETWEVIQSRLANSAGLEGDDNDLEMPNDGISIDLADPFTAMIFKVPVRGKACKHLECFDLENWLNTRLGKKSTCVCGGPNCKCPKEPSFVDKWRCPFCDGDARPYSLYVDEFLVEVRNQLEQANQLRTKSITVYANRSWQANDPAGDDDTDTDSDDGTTTRANSKAAPKSSVVHDVIEIDDD